MCARNERRGSAVRKRWRCVLPGSGGFFLSKKNEDIVHFDLPANTVLAPPTRLLADYPPILLDIRGNLCHGGRKRRVRVGDADGVELALRGSLVGV